MALRAHGLRRRERLDCRSGAFVVACRLLSAF
jgi:hypothetical protein